MLVMCGRYAPLFEDWAVSHIPDSDMIARTIAGHSAWIGVFESVIVLVSIDALSP